MSPRHAPVPRTRVGAAVARGIAIAVAVAGIGVGTWVLGSGPDPTRTDESAGLTDSGRSAGSGVLTAPSSKIVSEPPLSVAPAPPAAAERDALARATRATRAARAGAESKKGAKP